MSYQEHIPGPWYADPDVVTGDDGNLIWHVSNGENGGYLIASCPHQNGPGEANAYLIAAAPELLEALEIAMKEIRAWRSGVNTRTALDDLEKAKVGSCYGGLLHGNAAISKAKGGRV